MFDTLKIKSSLKDYTVFFDRSVSTNLKMFGTHFIVDSVISTIYDVPDHSIIIEATEANKSYEMIMPIVSRLLQQNMNRKSILVAVGGGIIQDITCFISSIWMRGITWKYIPTTLLGQTDSCIGSKSSINFGDVKNLLGTFNSPNEVYIDSTFLNTLEQKEIFSGIGEMIKLFAIDNKEFNLTDCLSNLTDFVKQSLSIKKRFIEEDEYDVGIRNILNYGHCIGHAIESATNYKVPHGIAVMIGMDVANHYSMVTSKTSFDFVKKFNKIMHPLYKEYLRYPVEFSSMRNSMLKDKKNTVEHINLIAPSSNEIVKLKLKNDDDFFNTLEKCIRSVYGQSM